MKLVNLTPHTITLRYRSPRFCPSCGGETVVASRIRSGCGGSGTIYDDVDVPIPSAGLARVDMMSGEPENVKGIPVPVYGPNQFGSIIGLPDPDPDLLYIVSMVVATTLRSEYIHGGMRADVVYPGTGPKDGAIRDANGQIVAVTRLVRA